MTNGNGNHHTSSGLPISDWNPGLKPAILNIRPEAGPQAEEHLEVIIRMLLAELGVDLRNEHFRDTPARVARFYREFTRGYTARPNKILKTFTSQSKDLVVVSHINFYSICPHHLLVYGGQIHFAYVPDGRIVGVSKIPRLVHALAARLVVQEALVADIADAFISVVKPLGCAIKASSHHGCVAARGVKCPSAIMTSMVTRGIFEEKETLCREFDRTVEQGWKSLD